MNQVVTLVSFLLRNLIFSEIRLSQMYPSAS